MSSSCSVVFSVSSQQSFLISLPYFSIASCFNISGIISCVCVYVCWKITLPEYMNSTIIGRHSGNLYYRITGKFGSSFNLVILTVDRQINVFRWMQRQCCSSHAWDAKLKSTNYVQMAHSPNTIVAKFSRYTVIKWTALNVKWLGLSAHLSWFKVLSSDPRTLLIKHGTSLRLFITGV